MKCKRSVLLIDAGNTSINLALATCGKVRRLFELPTKNFNQSVFSERLKSAPVQMPMDSVISSVVPSVTGKIVQELKKAAKKEPMLINWRMKSGLKIDVKHPSSVGPDRIASAAAAFAVMGGPLIVIDAGTATTFNCVTEKGQFLGGAIAPGPALFTSYLNEKTALLPKLKTSGKCPPIGRTTVGAMQIGFRAGYCSMVEGITKHLIPSLGKKTTIFCATGGGAAALQRCRLPFRIEKDLTFLGLHLIWQMNSLK